MLEVEEKGRCDDLAFARNQEDMENLANKEKEDRVIITGLTISVPMPTDQEAKIAWTRKMVFPSSSPLVFDRM